MPDGSEDAAELLYMADLFAYYRDEADRCREGGAYLASCVLLASALEAALVATCRCFPEEVDRFVKGRPGKELSRPQSEWGLAQLLLVATNLGWIPRSGERRDKLDPRSALPGDLIDLVRVLRNLIHPGIYRKEYPDERPARAITRRHLLISRDLLSVACECLQRKLESRSQSMMGEVSPNTTK